VTDQIRWINHAGYELTSNGVRIVHDPWIEGFAFQDGWSLVAQSRYAYEDFAGVDYIWFSHEHPDHFAPGVLRKIPENIRATITVLYRLTRDKRVVSFCRKLGFKVQELPDRQPVRLKNDITITCGFDGDDSWSFLVTPGGTYFNANDCVGARWREVARILPRPVDVLLTQFSYANWTGNPGDTASMGRQAAKKLQQMEDQLAAFAPRTLIPFASYVWFCRSENFHLNEGANRIDAVYGRFTDRVRTVVLYPGDTYSVGDASFDSGQAIRRYMADWSSHAGPLPATEQPVPVEALQQLSKKQQDALGSQNALWLLRPLSRSYLRPVKLFLADIDTGVEYSMFGGILRAGLAREDCELQVQSFSLANMLTNGYGYSTLYINGRFVELVPGAFARLSRHFAIFGQNAAGYRFPQLLLRPGYLHSHMARLLSGIAGKIESRS